MSQVEAVSTGRLAIPEELESASAKLVYLYLDVKGEASIHEIGADLDIRMITLCDLLATLENRGLVTRDGDSYRCQ